jgi:hypothetical protein
MDFFACGSERLRRFLKNTRIRFQTDVLEQANPADARKAATPLPLEPDQISLSTQQDNTELRSVGASNRG